MSVHSNTVSNKTFQSTTVRAPVSLGEIPLRNKRTQRQSFRLLGYMLKTVQRIKTSTTTSSKSA